MSADDDRTFWRLLWDRADRPLAQDAAAHIRALLIDTIAIGSHARAHTLGATAFDQATLEPLRAGRATLWGGNGASAHPLDAAQLNGTSAEVLDFQEVLIDGRNNGHAAVVIGPVLVALAEQHGASVGRLLKATRLALDANLLLLRALGRGHRAGRVGFRTTSMGSPIAAAFAGAYLVGADLDQAVQAGALAAAALPAGLLAAMDPEANSFSTDKDTAVGLSAQHAVQSVLWAERGASGPGAALTGARGWLASYGFDTAEEKYLRSFPSDEDLWRYQIKRFPVNFGAQAAVRAALTLADKVDSEAIEAVTIRVKQSSAASLRTRSLSTHAAARFSLPYAVASALIRKRSVLDDFEADALTNVQVLDLMERSTIEADADMEAEHQERGIFPAQITLKTADAADWTEAFEGPWDGLDAAERSTALDEKCYALVGIEATQFLRARLAKQDGEPVSLAGG